MWHGLQLMPLVIYQWLWNVSDSSISSTSPWLVVPCCHRVQCFFLLTKAIDIHRDHVCTAGLEPLQSNHWSKILTHILPLAFLGKLWSSFRPADRYKNLVMTMWVYNTVWTSSSARMSFPGTLKPCKFQKVARGCAPSNPASRGGEHPP